MKVFDQVFSEWAVAITIILTLIYFLSTSNFNYFKSLGVPYIKPAPLFGSTIRTALCLENWATVYQRFYDAFPKERSVLLLILSMPFSFNFNFFFLFNFVVGYSDFLEYSNSQDRFLLFVTLN